MGAVIEYRSATKKRLAHVTSQRWKMPESTIMKGFDLKVVNTQAEPL